ncbi:MAG TPA: DUF4124 domain-containing protein [Gammaproteobacteria bacterium]|nr:DUF4124 domain-containing protein [Gammaproteobacteria bacterium]
MYPKLMLFTMLLLACGAALAGQGPVYRWVKPDGTVVYSDTPSSPHARKVQIDEPDSASAPAPAAKGAGGKGRPGSGRAVGKAREAAGSGSGSSLCDQWRKRVALIRNHDQIYMKKKGGGRVKLTPKQRRQRLRQARAQVKQNCPAGNADGSTAGGTSGS